MTVFTEHAAVTVKSELLESGIELHYTQKDGNLNVFADHLKEGANEFLIKGYHGGA